MFNRALFALVLMASTPAAAQNGGPSLIEPNWLVPAQDRSQRPAIMSIREAAGIVQSRFGGRLLGGSLQDGPRPVYVLIWELPNGDRRDFRVDAVNGRIL